MRFSGRILEHGDQVELYIADDGAVMVYCWNDGFPSGAGGGHSLPMPEELRMNYNQERFICWLKQSFWTAIQIRHPADEEAVKAFLAENNRNSAAKPDTAPASSGS